MSVSIAMPSRAQSLATHIWQGIFLGVILTTLSYVVGYHMGWTTGPSLLEGFAVFTSYVCTWLCVVERRVNYPIGAVSNAAYSVMFWQLGLVGSSIVTGYLTFSLAYGWFRWKKDENTKPVQFVALKYWPAYIAATTLAFLIGLQLYHVFNTPVVWTDAVIMACSILAQFLMDNKKLESWIVWAIVNVFAIYTYFHAGAALAGFQYIFFLANTVYGFVMWKKAMNAPKTKPVITGISLGYRIDAKEGNKITAITPIDAMPVVKEVPVR